MSPARGSVQAPLSIVTTTSGWPSVERPRQTTTPSAWRVADLPVSRRWPGVRSRVSIAWSPWPSSSQAGSRPRQAKVSASACGEKAAARTAARRSRSTKAQHLAQQCGSALGAVLRHVEVEDGPNPVGPERQHPNVPVPAAVDDLCGGQALEPEDHDIARHARRVDDDARQAGHRFGEAAGSGMVDGEPRAVVLDGVERPGRDDAGLAHGAAEDAAEAAGAGGQCPRARERPADPGAQTPREADAPPVENRPRPRPPPPPGGRPGPPPPP